MDENNLFEEVSEKMPDDGSQAEMEQLKKERDEYLDGWKRAKADLINYKNEELTRLREISRFAGEDMMRDILVVIDSFDLGISVLGEESEGAAGKGMYMIRTQLEDVLRKKGLERVIVSTGSPFDPSLHEAIASIESNLPSGTVVDEVERGYLLNGKLLRPARVVVAK
ncbi:MAG: nucleotide exchange factor GrpE [Candidatus Colwellbacteria bacterium]|nr:nucleotide exchange factor GrpE [Candidatus Colwellbacteria bacterium]